MYAGPRCRPRCGDVAADGPGGGRVEGGVDVELAPPAGRDGAGRPSSVEARGRRAWPHQVSRHRAGVRERTWCASSSSRRASVPTSTGLGDAVTTGAAAVPYLMLTLRRPAAAGTRIRARGEPHVHMWRSSRSVAYEGAVDVEPGVPGSGGARGIELHRRVDGPDWLPPSRSAGATSAGFPVYQRPAMIFSPAPDPKRCPLRRPAWLRLSSSARPASLSDVTRATARFLRPS